MRFGTGGTWHTVRADTCSGVRRQHPLARSLQAGLTLPTSTRFVTMTMLAEFSCQIILQKSLTVSCIGPANRKGDDRVKGHKYQEAARRMTLLAAQP